MNLSEQVCLKPTANFCQFLDVAPVRMIALLARAVPCPGARRVLGVEKRRGVSSRVTLS